MSDKFVEIMKETFTGNPKEDSKTIEKYANEEIMRKSLLERKISLRRELSAAQDENNTELSSKLEKELSSVIKELDKF